MSRVFDTFLFLNEVELLELRFQTLAEVVDTFVLLETATTFAGRPNRPRWGALKTQPAFQPFADRVLHHVARLPPPTAEGNRWPVEYAMRNAIGDVLRPIAQPDDHILISDVDEIPDPACVRHRGTHVHRLFVYALNALFDQPWYGTVGVDYQQLLYHQPQYLRGNNAQWPKIPSGWHFSYMGGAARMREKVSAGGDAQFDHETYLSKVVAHAAQLEDPMGRIPPAGLRPGTLIALDETFPPYLLQHPERFPGWIRELPA